MGSLGLISTILLLTTALAYQNVGRVANSNLTLKWKFADDGYIEMAIEWLQPTFIGLMLGDTMINNDLWLCSLEPNMTEWGVLDRWYAISEIGRLALACHWTTQTPTFVAETISRTSKSR